jgi:pyruvate,water dikinase
LEHVDGFSIGSNDLTQLTLAIDRNSADVAHLFDERNPAVLALMRMAIEACNRRALYSGICGQAPSDHPELCQWLIDTGIHSISVQPDRAIQTTLLVAQIEAKLNSQ